MLLKVTPGDEDPLAAEGLAAAAGLVPDEFFPDAAFLAFCGEVG